jgi:nicotinamidase-related amidase
MDVAELFDHLDLNCDDRLDRSELHRAARRYGWHWHEAPLFALLDLFSIPAPISKQRFVAIIQQVMTDPMRVYGDVLLKSPHFTQQPRGKVTSQSPKHSTGMERRHQLNVASLLESHVGRDSLRAYRILYGSLDIIELDRDKAAILIIDPQKSFTQGVWMESIGANADIDVLPIRLAFDNCASLLQKFYRNMEIMFTRCPFPPKSYPWDTYIGNLLDENQLYFIKPGNSVLFPPTNGFQEWIVQSIEKGLKKLVIGGCTLNSCVRVSAIETQQCFNEQSLQVIVDISLCGARLRNFEISSKFDGKSAVASAVNQMKRAGVSVARKSIFK